MLFQCHNVLFDREFDADKTSTTLVPFKPLSKKMLLNELLQFWHKKFMLCCVDYRIKEAEKRNEPYFAVLVELQSFKNILHRKKDDNKILMNTF